MATNAAAAVARSVSVGIGKGGVGKSTIAANVSAAWAALYGEAVMLVDCDQQGTSTQLLLGPGQSADDGEELLSALTEGRQLRGYEVRPGLTLVTGGSHTRTLARRMRGAPDAAEAFAAAFAGHTYEAVIFDLPPSGQSALADAALASSSSLLVPTGPRVADIAGLGVLGWQLADDGIAVDLLGVVLNGSPVRATGQRAEARRMILEHLESEDLLCDAVIRRAEKAIDSAAAAGLTVAEYALRCAEHAELPVGERIRRRVSYPSNVFDLALEFRDLTEEVRRRFRALHRPDNGPEEQER